MTPGHAAPDPAGGLTPEARATLEKVLELLAADRASLSSVTDERAWGTHVVDSLTGLEIADLQSARRIADIGSGAGFPGFPLAVALPAASVDLIESIARKCAFLSKTIAAAQIPNATVICARSEDIATTDKREGYEAVTARAVGRLSTLAKLASPLLEEGGVLDAWKGKRDPEEDAQLARAAESLAMSPELVLDVGDRAGSQHRHLHVIRKSGPTPSDLPRRPGIAKKRPKG